MSAYYTPNPTSSPQPPAGAPVSRTLVLHEAGPLSLLACGLAREAMDLAGPRTARDLGAVLFGARGRVAQAAAARQCDLTSATLLEMPGLPLPAELPVSQRELHELVHAVHFAAKNGYERVVWPVSGALGDHLDLDRVSLVIDRAILVSRLVALDAGEHKVPSIRVETPYADYTDRQVADLLADMELPIEACWFWPGADAEAQREKSRWMAAMEAVGWVRS